jgi:pyruvate/2-oxoglutarate dehydrogenase complex dihydrolipoamide dehydrogenase (E3) component
VFESSSKLRVTGPQTTHITFEHAILATGSRARALPGTEFKEGAGS